MNRRPWMVLIGTCAAGMLLTCGGSAPARGAGDGTSAPASASALRQNLAWQIALDRAGFSPGVLDGKVKGKTEVATREFQKARGLSVTGSLDAATSAALGVNPGAALTTYTVTAGDLAQVGPVPKGWLAKSKAHRLAYPSLDEALAEKFHCTRALLAMLNAGRSIARLKAGDAIQAPAVSQWTTAARGERIDINLSQKIVRVYGADGRVVAMFHCSIAADKAKRPSGKATVAVIAFNPTYNFDPKMWKEVKGIKQKLIIPPGPRNPVGLCWLGLSLHGYGMHGSPSPEMIGKTGSHGCFRLTNWDAIRMGKMIHVGIPVTFS